MDYVSRFGEWLLSLVKLVLKTLWDMVDDLLCWLVDVVFSIADATFTGLGMPNLAEEMAKAMSGLPPEVLGLFGAVGLDYAFGIVVLAYVVRFVLQLIPFVRLGS